MSPGLNQLCTAEERRGTFVDHSLLSGSVLGTSYSNTIEYNNPMQWALDINLTEELTETQRVNLTEL